MKRTRAFGNSHPQGLSRQTQGEEPATRGFEWLANARCFETNRWRQNRSRRTAQMLMVAVVSVCLTGCFGFLKPASSTARHFVLAPVQSGVPSTSISGSIPVGLAQVKIPSYLFDTSLVVRKGTNEISYLPSMLWAERLDVGLQRVLAANLSTLLPTDQVRLSAWRSEDVSVEVSVYIEQFDFDSEGHCVLAARWRIVSPGGEKILRTGETHLARRGSSPEVDPSGAVASLSELVGDFSRELAQAIKTVTPVNGAGVGRR